MSKRGLGKGLGVLMSSVEAQYEGALPEASGETGVQEVAVSRIKPNPWQPRQVFDKEKLDELAASIKAHGIIQPLIVRKKGLNFELVAGERRLRAAKKIKLTKVPVLIREYEEEEMGELALVENIQRHDLNPIEEAVAIKDLMERAQLTQAKAAERLGRSRTAIANSIRLLNLPDLLQNLVAEEKLTTGQVRPLLALQNEALQAEAGELILKQDRSARQAEDIVRFMKDGLTLTEAVEQLDLLLKGDKEEENEPEEISEEIQEEAENTDEEEIPSEEETDTEEDVHIRAFANELIAYLGTKVRIAPKSKNKGKIEIDYYSLDDLDRICSLLQGENGNSEKNNKVKKEYRNFTV